MVGGLAHDVVELQGTPLAFEPVIGVPGVGPIAEEQECAVIRRHLGDDILQIAAAAQQAQASAGQWR